MPRMTSIFRQTLFMVRAYFPPGMIHD